MLSRLEWLLSLLYGQRQLRFGPPLKRLFLNRAQMILDHWLIHASVARLMNLLVSPFKAKVFCIQHQFVGCYLWRVDQGRLGVDWLVLWIDSLVVPYLPHLVQVYQPVVDQSLLARSASFLFLHAILLRIRPRRTSIIWMILDCMRIELWATLQLF